MQSPATMPTQQTTGPLRHAASPGPAERVMRERLLLSACVICGLVIAFQLGVTLLHPNWISAISDWLRSTLAWPEWVIVLFASLHLSRAHHPSALAWWMWSAVLLCNIVGQTLWTVEDQFVFHHGVPFPNWPDVFYLLQYPFLFLAVALLPHTSRLGPRLILIVDGLLVMAAANAVSWYFILAPLSAQSGLSDIARTASLAYPVGDLFVLCGLTLTLMRPSRYRADRLVLGILIVSVVCLIAADSLAVWEVIYGDHVYHTGGLPDVLWDAFYLLVALAALVQLRLAYDEPPGVHELVGSSLDGGARLQRQDIRAGLRLFLPIFAALLASGVILMCATIRTASGTATRGWMGMIIPFGVSFGLLLLVILRQGVAFMENSWLRREMDVARAEELMQRELNRRKDEFVTIVGHELKTPLTSLQGYIQLMARRFAASPKHQVRDEEFARTIVRYEEGSVHRITRLVDDLLDESSIRNGRLVLHVEPCELGTLVRSVVEEHRILHAERHIQLKLPSAPVPILADALRIRQVITNYLTNALKFSREDQPVEVTLEVDEGKVARVAVHDLGRGVPASKRAHIWDLYYQAEGIEVQTGSGVGLGIGLYLSKSLIEAHSGQVGVDSTVGKGSTFWFTLPLAE